MSHPSVDAGPLADPVLSAAQQANLGALQRSFVPKRQKRSFMIMNYTMGILLLPLFGIGIIFFVFAYMTPNLNKSLAAKRLHLFERGLILANAKGPTAVVRWDAATVLQEIVRQHVNGIYVGTNYIYTLTTPDGRKVKVTGFFAEPETWGHAIQVAITEAQLPGVLATLQQNQSVHFGPVVINRGGISTGSKSVPWNEVQDIDIASGYLRIKRAGGWLRWSSKPISAIPNFFVLLNAALQLRAAYPQGQPAPTA